MLKVLLRNADFRLALITALLFGTSPLLAEPTKDVIELSGQIMSLWITCTWMIIAATYYGGTRWQHLKTESSLNCSSRLLDSLKHAGMAAGTTVVILMLGTQLYEQMNLIIESTTYITLSPFHKPFVASIILFVTVFPIFTSLKLLHNQATQTNTSTGT